MTFTALREAAGFSQRGLAETVGVSAATINNIEHGRPPKNWAAVKPGLAAVLAGRAVKSEKTVNAVLSRIGMKAKPAARGDKPVSVQTEEEDSMISRKQSFTGQARQHFTIGRDPFAEVQCEEDIYICSHSRYVREAILSAAKFGNFMAVVGESGSGKTTLANGVEEQLAIDDPSVVFIKPYILGLSSSEKAGKPLKARDIAEAIILTIDKDAGIPSTNEQMFRKVHTMLKEGRDNGRRYVVRIEEAHELNTHTLKTLKRFWEMADGMKRLLSIILIGQTELGDKLTSTAKDIREVVQRCEIVTLSAIPDVGEYIRFRFARAGMNADAVFEAEALAALRHKLIVSEDASGKGTDMAYPLAIGNLATAAINLAAEAGEERVTAEVVQDIQA